jgi:hypothetical protein
VAVLTARALLLLAAAALAGCFDPPRPGCAFSCARDGRCPSGYSCATDGVCHRDDGQGTCNIPPQTDAGTDLPTDVQTDVQTD